MRVRRESAAAAATSSFVVRRVCLCSVNPLWSGPRLCSEKTTDSSRTLERGGTRRRHTTRTVGLTAGDNKGSVDGVQNAQTSFMANNQNLSTSAHRALAHEYKSLQEEPVEGFRVKLIEDNLREWEVAIFGPPETLYQGGYFKVHLICAYAPYTRFRTRVYLAASFARYVGHVHTSVIVPPIRNRMRRKCISCRIYAPHKPLCFITYYYYNRLKPIY